LYSATYIAVPLALPTRGLSPDPNHLVSATVTPPAPAFIIAATTRLRFKLGTIASIRFMGFFSSGD